MVPLLLSCGRISSLTQVCVGGVWVSLRWDCSHVSLSQAQLHQLYSQNSKVITILVNKTSSSDAFSYQRAVVSKKRPLTICLNIHPSILHFHQINSLPLIILFYKFCPGKEIERGLGSPIFVLQLNSHFTYTGINLVSKNTKVLQWVMGENCFFCPES